MRDVKIKSWPLVSFPQCFRINSINHSKPVINLTNSLTQPLFPAFFFAANVSYQTCSPNGIFFLKSCYQLLVSGMSLLLSASGEGLFIFKTLSFRKLSLLCQPTYMPLLWTPINPCDYIHHRKE